MLTLLLAQSNTTDNIRLLKSSIPCGDKVKITLTDNSLLPQAAAGDTLIVEKKDVYRENSLLLVQTGRRLCVKRFHAYPDCVLLQDPDDFKTTHYRENAVLRLPVEPLAEVLEIVKP